MVSALCAEIELKSKLHSNPLLTVYFGGGTPSLLSKSELSLIMNSIYQHFDTTKLAEVTLEANPEDINEFQLADWLQLGINRLSVGVQSFNNEQLKFANRAHDAITAEKALKQLSEAGFSSYTADLIFGIPGFTLNEWDTDLDKMISFQVPHLSIYGLTIESRTAFGKWVKTGKISEPAEEKMATAFTMAHEKLTAAGYIHYEVSNYALPSHYSKHNSAYWSGTKYIGIGPGAHSFTGDTRAFNVSNNKKYMESIHQKQIPETVETLSETDKLNEYIFTRLRAKDGLDLNYLKDIHQLDLISMKKQWINPLVDNEMILLESQRLRLTLKGMLIADEISLKLLFDDH
ncbi:MAG: oxygen-independent coproporphyrinogen-3 oxidase [Cyclobacteriaceae bacterium]|jgi:oxygen-independent coproporphyrinogen-3 oxidase